MYSGAFRNDNLIISRSECGTLAILEEKELLVKYDADHLITV